MCLWKSGTSRRLDVGWFDFVLFFDWTWLCCVVSIYLEYLVQFSSGLRSIVSLFVLHFVLSSNLFSHNVSRDLIYLVLSSMSFNVEGARAPTLLT